MYVCMGNVSLFIAVGQIELRNMMLVIMPGDIQYVAIWQM